MEYDFRAAIEAAANEAPQLREAPVMVPGLTLHVDGDYLAYFASGNDETTQGQARTNAVNLLEAARVAAGAEHIVVHNTAKGCNKGERYLIATVKPYQANRKSGVKPRNHSFLQDWLMEYEGAGFKVKNWLTREADDGMAACLHHAIGTPQGYAAIFTADKDLRMIPGLHVIWKHVNGFRETVRVSPGCFERIGPAGKMYGTKFFWLQMLMGDTADNCPGLEGHVVLNAKKEEYFKPMGEKTAEAYLKDCKTNDDAYEVVSALYRKYYDRKGGNWADRFCEQAALLWMRCDAKAHILDFANHSGHSRISGRFCDELLSAVARLEKRVTDERTKINSFSDS
jgi:hypothetical protein